MKHRAAVTGLSALLDLTEQCKARAISAQREAVRYVDHYRVQAEQFKMQAGRTHSREMRESLLRIAASHERLVRLAEGVEGVTEGFTAPSGDREPAQEESQGAGREPEYEEETVTRRPAEDPVAQARRHVAQAQGHIARQEALVARLSSDDRHTALAAEAREILDTLRHTLDLARQHLAIELKK